MPREGGEASEAIHIRGLVDWHLLTDTTPSEAEAWCRSPLFVSVPFVLDEMGESVPPHPYGLPRGVVFFVFWSNTYQY